MKLKQIMKVMAMPLPTVPERFTAAAGNMRSRAAWWSR